MEKSKNTNKNILIRGISIPNRKQIKIGLTYIYGLGRYYAEKICKKIGLSGNEKTYTLTPEQILAISNELNEYTILADLSNKNKNRILDLINIKCNRGMRHIKKFPVRGQSTRRNAVTCRKAKKW